MVAFSIPRISGRIAPCLLAVAASQKQPKTTNKPRDDSTRDFFSLQATQCEERSHPKFNNDWDLRHPRDDSVAFQGPTRVMLLIRHGQYENRGGPGFGELTDIGREQATMAGRHIVERMRADAEFKKSMYRITSSNLSRAIETADLIEREIVAELEWVDVAKTSLPSDLRLRMISQPFSGYAIFSISELNGSFEVCDKNNFLQPCLTVRQGSQLRLRHTASDVSKWKDGITLADMLAEVEQVSVHQALEPVRRMNDNYDDWECSGYDKAVSTGAVYWSDNAETNRVGFSEQFFKSGTCSKLDELRAKGDTFARVTEGTPCSPFRMPNDKNLNEANADICSVLLPGDSLYEEYGQPNSENLQGHAQVEAAFYSHFYRSVDHKRIARKDRIDTMEFVFTPVQDGKRSVGQWTASEFAKLCFDADGQVPWILKEDGQGQVDGPFRLHAIDREEVDASNMEAVRQLTAEKFKKKAKDMPSKRIEILVCHQNVIRYFFLKSLQFDTTAWLNLGGSNCTMTQLRLTKKGDVICDFFGDHGSMLPVKYYTFNKSPDV